MISGVVANSGWHNVFYIYLALIPVFLCIIFFIPTDSHTEEKTGEVKSILSKGVSKPLPPEVIMKLDAIMKEAEKAIKVK